MTWTRTPPTKPGRYRCRFLPAEGIDREPFEVELRTRSTAAWSHGTDAGYPDPNNPDDHLPADGNVPIW